MLETRQIGTIKYHDIHIVPRQPYRQLPVMKPGHRKEQSRLLYPECPAHLVLLLLRHLLQQYVALLVLAALVLEPDADDAGGEPRHLRQLLLHEGVGARVGAVARAQRVKLFLVEDGADSRRLLVGLVRAAAGPAGALRRLYDVRLTVKAVVVL